MPTQLPAAVSLRSADIRATPQQALKSRHSLPATQIGLDHAR